MNPWILFGLIVGAIHVAGLLVLVACAKWAPEGYEDADGFHLGTEQAKPALVRGDPAEGEWKHAA